MFYNFFFKLPLCLPLFLGIFNDGTELRISNIRHEDIGDYTCIARNGEGQISHTARVIIAGGAVIMVPPTNQTKLEGEKVQFNCEAKALPGNVTVKWFREGAPVKEVAALETRVTIRRDGSLVVNPVSADDSGQYLCEVSNGIGEPQSASAYLNVECESFLFSFCCLFFYYNYPPTKGGLDSNKKRKRYKQQISHKMLRCTITLKQYQTCAMNPY